jgi:serine phosphatase RsbU (regulator of sigma subunit)
VLETGGAPRPQTGFACGEVRGGNDIAHSLVDLPGLRGIVYSRPCEGASGGDIHYLSRCGSGLMARVCLADVAGHGPMVAAVGREIHDHLRRSVDVVDERKVFTRFNSRLESQRLLTMTTAVLVTYYPPSRRLTVSYAGHPRGWLYRGAERAWEPLYLPVQPPPTRPAYIDLPLGVGLPTTFTRHRFKVQPGDRVLLITDGVLETTSPDDAPFDTHGVEAILKSGAAGYEELAARLVTALHEHAEVDHLAHDDVTFFLGEFTEGPRGPALWHVVKNRLLQRA